MQVNRDCFLCRVMRSFALTGLSAGACGFVAMVAGFGQLEAIYAALFGGLFIAVTFTSRRA